MTRRLADGLGQVLIRPARGVDLDAVRALLAETWHDTYDAIHGAEEVARMSADWHAPARLLSELRQPSHALLVAEVDGMLAGTASATLEGAGAIRLGRLYVHPSRQRAGLGGALLDACLRQFPGATGISLEVDPENGKGRAFYAKLGFAERAERNAQDNIVCERLLPAGRPEGRALVVRPVRDADAQDLFGLMTLCFADYPGCFVDPHEDLADLRAPAEATARKGGRFWVVEDGSGRVGASTSVDLPEPGLAELHRVYVRPDLRRRGLAEMLVALAEDEARARGASRIFFWSDTRFTTAHRFYRRLGYLDAGEERVLPDISRSTEYRFHKAL